MTSEDAAILTTELAEALRSPQEIVNSSYEIDEGEYVFHSFELLTAARVRLQLNARPEPVDVILMTPADFDKYRRASEEGGSYSYRELLSRKQVVQFDSTETLPKGEWTIVVARPIEDIDSPQSTTADITITVY